MATSSKIVASVLVVGLVLGAGITAAIGPNVGPGPADSETPSQSTVDDGLTTFESANEYTEYVRRGAGGYGVASASMASAADGGNGAASGGDAGGTTAPEAQSTGVEFDQSTSGEASARIGGTNVQERGIDEPDLVATVGQHFVYAPGGMRAYAFRGDVARSDAIEPSEPAPERSRSAHVLDVSDPVSPELVAEIDASGTLLRSGDTLVVLGNANVTGYDVSDPTNPTETWSKPLDSAIETARIVDGQLYVVTRTNAHRPCPIRPMGGSEIACTQIHRPHVQVNVDATYTAFSIEPSDGSVSDSTSFVGTARSTVVYVSENALYVTYTERTDHAELATDYVIEEATMVPADVKDRLRQIDGYDISTQAKQMEMQRAVQGWLQSLTDAERRDAEASLAEGMREYAKEHQREFTETGIVRIGVGDGDLSVDATGSVPGEPLNQFSMDEHDGTLRIATTIPQLYGAESQNDLHTLDATTLDRLGAETGMGVDERIYSVRYVNDTAYMVTFRQIDPFHVVDISDPSNPQELGNVELPGFSDYLHPVGEDAILGIGQEDGQVKAVLFDVSDPANPTVADSTILDARWSAVSQTHHAFMHDPRHGVAFLPAGEQGIVLDYTNGSLDVEQKVTLDSPPERARYVGDYLYVFSPTEIQVLDETTWETETSVELDG